MPCRNEALTVTQLLGAIANQSQLPSQIVIVDDASTDGTPEIVRAWAASHPAVPVRLVHGAGQGAAAAMNKGIEASDADVIVRLDGHCRPDRHYVAMSVATLESSVGVAGGVWRIEPGAATPTARGIAAVMSYPLGSGGAAYRQARESRGVRRVDTVPFGTFPRSVWRKLQGFDEALLRNQDYDFNYRVRMIGLAVVLNPSIVSTYRARASLRELARQYFDYGVWKVVMLRKFPASLRVRQALPLALLPLLLVLFGAFAATLSAWPLSFLALYCLLNVAGGLHASFAAGVPTSAPAACAALLTLQLSWSAGAWWSLIRGAHARGL